MIDHLSRRDFFRAAALAGTAVSTSTLLRGPQLRADVTRSPNERLNLAVIGVAARGAANLSGVSSENIVALCDIDAARLGKAAEEYPKAQTTDDFRRLFDIKNLDGMVVSTPDHMHAIPVARALRQGLAVYCEKPLTHSVYEARVISRLTEEKKAVTQMGNQIHNHPAANYRRVVEMIKAGMIGPVRRVHVWQGGSAKPGQRVGEAEVPTGINYDMWLGPAPYRPFHLSHFHFNWRYWWDFGGGQLGDFCCHFLDLPYWALDLEYPTAVAATGEKAHDGDNLCPGRMRVEYEYPARGDLPPVHITWYHGGWKPKGAEVYGKGSAVLFEGTDGRLLADYTTRKLFMQAGKDAHPVKPSIPDSIGHHREWIEAVKTGGPTTCNFQYGAKLTEAGLLGNVSYRAGQRRLEWDAAQMRATNVPEADEFLRREYRKGWTL